MCLFLTKIQVLFSYNTTPISPLYFHLNSSLQKAIKISLLSSFVLLTACDAHSHQLQKHFMRMLLEPTFKWLSGKVVWSQLQDPSFQRSILRNANSNHCARRHTIFNLISAHALISAHPCIFVSKIHHKVRPTPSNCRAASQNKL